MIPFVRGERGKAGRGYSLKDPNRTGNYYVYVWKRKMYDPDKVKQRRQKNKNYSYVGGWSSIGRADKPETWEKLKEHLLEQYGDNEGMKEYLKELEISDIQRMIEEEMEILEKERMRKEKEERNRLESMILEYVEKTKIDIDWPEEMSLENLRKLAEELGLK